MMGNHLLLNIITDNGAAEQLIDRFREMAVEEDGATSNKTGGTCYCGRARVEQLGSPGIGNE